MNKFKLLENDLTRLRETYNDKKSVLEQKMEEVRILKDSKSAAGARIDAIIGGKN